MEKQLYPKLKDMVRIKQNPDYCWVTELFSGSGILSASEAFVVSLCTGEYKISDIMYIFAGTFRMSNESAAKTVTETLERMNRFIDLLSAQETSKKSRYQPQDFLNNCRMDIQTVFTRMPAPAEMTFNLTRKCNFRCVYCYNSSAKAIPGEMDASFWLKAVQQAKDLDVLKCTLTGGEPMLHPGFFDILGALLQCDILPYICTNGSLIDDRAVSRFTDLGTPLVQISLDTPSPETQDQLTAVSGSFPRVTHAIEALSKVGISVYVKAVMLPANYSEAGGLIDLCYNSGVKNLILDQYDLCYAGRGSNVFFLSEKENRQLKKIAEEKRKIIGNKMNINLIQTPRCWSSSKDIVPCGAFQYSFNIMPDGEYALCEKIEPRRHMSAGNFKTMSIEKMWNSPRTKALMKPDAGSILEPCRSCEHLDVCNTGCFAAKQFVTDNLYAPDPRCWLAEYENNAYKVEN